MDIIIFDIEKIFYKLVLVSFQTSILIAIILAIKGLLGKRLPAVWHYGLWFIFMARLAIPWGLESHFSLYNLLPVESDLDFQQSLSIAVNHVLPDVVTPLESGSFLLGKTDSYHWLLVKGPSFIWLSVATLLLLLVCIRSAVFLKAVRSHKQLTHQKTLDLLEACKKELDVKTVLGIIETDLVSSPTLFGYIRPRILLPKDMLSRMSATELRYIFLHELQHLKHQDILTAFTAYLLIAIHWLNPLVWIAFHNMRRDREFACDAKVLKHLNTDEHKSYGYVLLSLTSGAAYPKPLPGLTGIIELKSEIKRRIEMIANFKRTTIRHSLFFAAFFIILGLTALTNATSPEKASERNLQAKSESVTTLLTKGNYSDVTQLFDQTMKDALPPHKLQKTWESLESQAGEFKEILKTRFEPNGEFRIIFVTCAFARSTLDLKLVYNQRDDISGMWFVPPQQ